MLHLSWVAQVLHKLNSLLEIWSNDHVKEDGTNQFYSKVVIHLNGFYGDGGSLFQKVDHKDEDLHDTSDQAGLGHTLLMVLLNIWVHHHDYRVSVEVSCEVICLAITIFDFSELSVVFLNEIHRNICWLSFPIDEISMSIYNSWGLIDNGSH